MGALDESLFRFINGWPEALRPFFWFLSEATKQDWVRGVLALMVLGMLIRSPRSRTAILLALLAWAAANGITEALKTGIHALRPCVALAEVNLRVGKLTSFGTASSHAANMAAIAFVFTAMLGRWGWPWIVLAFFVGLSRIYVGVHFPYQVLFGWVCGTFSGFLMVHMHRNFVRMRRRRKGSPNAPLESVELNQGSTAPTGTAEFRRRPSANEEAIPRTGTADFSRRPSANEEAMPRTGTADYSRRPSANEEAIPRTGTADFRRRSASSYNL